MSLQAPAWSTAGHSWGVDEKSISFGIQPQPDRINTYAHQLFKIYNMEVARKKARAARQFKAEVADLIRGDVRCVPLPPSCVFKTHPVYTLSLPSPCSRKKVLPSVMTLCNIVALRQVVQVGVSSNNSLDVH